MPINKNTNNNQLAGAFVSLSDAIKKEIDGAIPCKVIKVNSTRTRVTVKPLIKVVDNNGTEISRQNIAGLTVFNAGAGDIVLSFPIKIGDLGWIQASDRDISIFLQSYAESAPPTRRKHSLSDARFIPDLMRNFTISPEDENAVVLQIRDSTVKISLDSSQIRIHNNDAKIELDSAKITASTSTVTITIDGSSVTGIAPGGFDLNGFQIDASGAAISPVSVSAPLIAASSGLTKSGVPVADQQHNHGPGSYVVGENPVTGTSGASNG